ncbi:DNA-binding transcriptional regulator HcaR [Arthrobacter saudimassiliensis]|uniref:DNA-binding transcriptional regulator HcaR n=1 Tax=Arthrobacter saudimassiliensis TaxID=1461584 RepID=A0A078MQU4_9MICC|nr:DNA-binding transcriptional regulator HcaR [Arthrobacter saudimassiliensis]
MAAKTESDSSALRVAYVPGVTPGKWLGRWRERSARPLDAFPVEETAAEAMLRSGEAHLAFLRFPAEGYARPQGLSAVPLYVEQPVVLAPRDHELSLFDELDLAALAGETLLDPAEMGGAGIGVEVVASGAGLMLLPMSVARLHSRRDVVARPVRDAAATRIVLAWPEDADSDTIQEFVGVVRGRTANSSRQPSAEAPRSGKAGKGAGTKSAKSTGKGTGTAAGTRSARAAGRGGRTAGGAAPRRRGR